MITINLSTATDADINALVAEHVMGWDYSIHGEAVRLPNDEFFDPLHDANDTMAMLSQFCEHGWMMVDGGLDFEETRFCVYIYGEGLATEAKMGTWQRAACIAALRAVGVEVVE